MNAEVIEDVYAGTMSLARKELETCTDRERGALLARLSEQIRISLRVIPRTSREITPLVLERFSQGHDPAWNRADGFRSHIYSPLNGNDEVLALGPIPALKGPGSARLLVAAVLIMMLLAVFTVVLVRPVMAHLREIERAASAIAEGDLTARIPETAVPAARTGARAFNSMAERITRLLLGQRELLQAVSHELRTPLARIRFGLELIGEAVDTNEKVQRQLEKIDDAIQELDDHVDELLRYVRLDSNQVPQEKERIDAQEAIREAVKSCYAMFPSIKYELVLPSDGSPPSVLARRRDFYLALRNILVNAGRFARSRVLVRISNCDDRIEVDVEDDGPGIPLEDRERVFEPYVRVGHSSGGVAPRARRPAGDVRVGHSSGGVGLGLAIVRRVADSYGGAVSLEESALGGCLFRTRWPRG